MIHPSIFSDKSIKDLNWQISHRDEDHKERKCNHCLKIVLHDSRCPTIKCSMLSLVRLELFTLSMAIFRACSFSDSFRRREMTSSLREGSYIVTDRHKDQWQQHPGYFGFFFWTVNGSVGVSTIFFSSALQCSFWPLWFPQGLAELLSRTPGTESQPLQESVAVI